MLKEVQVVLLPTDKPKINGLNIYRKGEGNLKLPITGAEARRLEYNGYSCFNLYLVSEEDTSKDTYVYYDNGKLSGIVKRDENLFETTIEPLSKKIIATTDDALSQMKVWDDINDIVKRGELGEPDAVKSLIPVIPKSFLQEFVNSKGKIENVYLDYKCDWCYPNDRDIFCKDLFMKEKGHCSKTLITTEGNKIIIHLIESKK